MSVQAVHMALVRGDTLFGRPHSQVLAWGNWSTAAPIGGGLWGWRPTTDASAQAALNLSPLAVGVPPHDVFCAGHTALGDGDLLIVSGTERGKTGAPQSARFDFLSRQWSAAAMAGRRWYANATALADGSVLATAGNAGHHMLCFGGLAKNGSDAAVLSNDVRRYRITGAGQWDASLTDPSPGDGLWPAAREFPTLTDKAATERSAGGPYYLFGGKNSAGVTIRDIWQLRLRDNDLAESYEWKQVVPVNPEALFGRWRHAAFVVPSNPDTLATMYVHGGERVTATGTTPLDDMWKLSWRTDRAPIGWYWDEVIAQGDVPPGPRVGHSMFWDRENNRAILYGGRVNGALSDPDVYELKFPAGVPTWTRVPPKSNTTVPAARTRHAMAWNPKVSTGLIFGGETAAGLSDQLLELTVSVAPDSVSWSVRPPGSSSAPAPRADATIAGYEEYPTSYLVVGGELSGGAWDANTYEFRFDDARWRTLTPAAPALRGHRTIVENRILTTLQPERFDPASDTWSAFGQTKMRQSYHTMFAASDGMLYSCGPNRSATDTTFRFDPSAGIWSTFNVANGPNAMDATVSGVLYRPNRILKVGDSDILTATGEFRPASLAMQIDEASPQWRQPVVAMGRGRMDHTVSMLPTGDVIVTGGTGKGDDNDGDPDDNAPRRRPEIWDPTTVSGTNVGSWYWGTSSGDSLAAEPVTRAHHSSVVLLPDGRLLSGGGWDYHPFAVRKSVDQYSPPYLFLPTAEGGGPVFRPRLYGAQEHIAYDTDFKVTCPDGVVEACLIRPGASTHAFNHDCRYVPLSIVAPAQDGHRVTLHSPANASIAPPGNYLLFVLRDDNGRKVPSIARWVHVGSSQPVYATWDTLAPAVINTLAVTSSAGYTHTLQWTAAGDAGDGSSGKATRYELRYRANAAMSTMDDFFNHGRRVDPSLLPTPGTAGTTQSVTVTVPGLAPDTVYHFMMISRDGAGSDRNWSALGNEAVTPIGGGCPFVDTHTASGWQVENSILGRSLSGAMALDGYRLRYAPQVVDGRVRIRVRENEQELTTLDQLRLIAVDHAPGVRAYAVGDQVVLGSRAPARRVTTNEGRDITALVNGSGAGFMGGPGDTLLVEFNMTVGLAAYTEGTDATASHDPFLEGDGGKCPPDCSPLRSAEVFSASGVDAQVLSHSGIRIQAQGPGGEWQTVTTRYPREYPDEVVMNEVGHGPLRIVFVGYHTVNFLGRLELGGSEFAARKLPLLAAGHTRFGDVSAAVDSIGNLTTELAPGDTVQLEFGWEPPADGQVRELFLLSHGVYTGNLPARLQESPPVRFAIEPWRPNPFVGSARLRFALPSPQHVRLQIVDAQGRRVRLLADQTLASGAHSLEWDGRDEAGSRVSAGIYFYQFVAGEHRANGRLALVP